MNGDRVRFITHQGQRILLVDLSGCNPTQVGVIADLVPSYVTAEPRGSVLLLADFSNAQLDRDSVEHLKKAMVFDRPHVKRSAWIGAAGFPRAFYENVKAFTVREFPIFQTRDQALAYLVGEDEESTQGLASPA
ncbi:MAG TPA: hypothetical protein VJQ50_06255 [Terriglobales bacterium]|nr:hypothetical protein [Terriglobales bacterium]